MQIPPGTRIGPYEVIEEIGAGGMGHVYRAHDARLGRDVAIKTLPEHLGQDQRDIGSSGHFQRWLTDKTVRVWTMRDGVLATLFEFSDADVRIDYPSVSPDGRWILFDRFRPEGGDIWLAEGLGPRRR